MERKRKPSIPLPVIVIAAAVVILAVVLIVALGGKSDKDKVSPEVADGIAFLESLEEKDPAVVQQVRKDIFQRELDARREELITQLTDGTIDPFSLFKDYVIMGDSRAVGFWYFDYLDKDRVLADGGHTIRNITAQMDDLVALNPSCVFLCYGLNDTSIGYWDTAEEYVTEYVQVVQQVQEKLPEAKIIVSSILPARDPAFERASAWYNIPDWSAALEQACAENDIIFVNCDRLAEEYPEYWDPDGIHLRPAFYPYWSALLIYPVVMEDV